MIPGVEGWRLPGVRDVTGADLGNESEVAREGRGGLVVSKGIIPVTHEGGSVSRKSPRLSQDKLVGRVGR